jgi:hypothetical protein
MAPLIFRMAFTLLHWRVQVAVGMSIQPAGPVEGEVVLEDVPQLRTYRLWHAWQLVVERCRASSATAQEVGS